MYFDLFISQLSLETSPNVTIPDTPPSLRDKIKRKQVTEEATYPTKTPHLGKKDSPLHRRLFMGGSLGDISSNDEEPVSPIMIAPGPLNLTPSTSRGSSPASKTAGRH